MILHTLAEAVANTPNPYQGWIAFATVLGAVGGIFASIVALVIAWWRRRSDDSDDQLLQLLLEERARREAAEQAANNPHPNPPTP